MGSIARVFSIHGSQFDAGVAHVGDAVEKPAEKLKLPDRTFYLLMELPHPKNPANQAEFRALLSERATLNERTLRYVEARIAEQRADLEAAHEQEKLAVREQDALLESLNQKFAADQQEVIRARNILIKAQTEAYDAERSVKSLPRFSSRKDEEAARKRIESANVKMETAERNAADLSGALNYLQMVTILAARKKRQELVEKVMEAAAQLEGRDPHMARLGMLQR
jgi:hypothetical protein